MGADRVTFFHSLYRYEMSRTALAWWRISSSEHGRGSAASPMHRRELLATHSYTIENDSPVPCAQYLHTLRARLSARVRARVPSR